MTNYLDPADPNKNAHREKDLDMTPSLMNSLK
jgi:hypothetical protein